MPIQNIRKPTSTSSRLRHRARQAPREDRDVGISSCPASRSRAPRRRPRETVTAFLRRTSWATHDRNYGWQFRKGPADRPRDQRRGGAAQGVAQAPSSPQTTDVRFVSYPLGGGNNGVKQIIGLVTLIAVSAFALWAGPALFGAGTFGALATTAAIGIGGSLLINALVGPKPGATNAPAATQDQIYSARRRAMSRGSGNRCRSGTGASSASRISRRRLGASLSGTISI